MSVTDRERRFGRPIRNAFISLGIYLMISGHNDNLLVFTAGCFVLAAALLFVS
jgi:hypothetical protein